MATSSQVKTALDAIAVSISNQRKTMEQIKLEAQAASDVLGELSTVHADVVATITAYGTANDFEALSKAELAKLTTEFTALKGHADNIAAVDLDS